MARIFSEATLASRRQPSVFGSNPIVFTGINRISVVVSGVETVLLPMFSTFKFGTLNVGFTFQAESSGNVVISSTLMDPVYALDSANDAEVPWKVVGTATAAGATVVSGEAFTVLKLAFVAAGTLFISGF